MAKTEFDFDIAWDAAPTLDEIKKMVEEVARKHGVVITDVNPEGPGGGNPNFFAEADDDRGACEFLVELYRDPKDHLNLYGLQFETHEEMIQEIADTYDLHPGHRP